ncbi:DUF2177 family protein [Brevundimonas sp.]|uniref:DUF2177 family protein n=1 Tax=Brevundimonas sp. TaxID=1871086 RepID=UPI002631F474|nr:DUF2177 family protein [Brevundimonas sp.]
MRYLAAFGISAVVMLALDAVWLTVMGDRLYRPVLGDWMRESFLLPPAIAFYVLFLSGVTFLATVPALQQGSWQRAAINGAVFGLVAYATYDLTNQATLTRWSMTITLVDMTWGTFLAATAALAGYFGSRLMVR